MESYTLSLFMAGPKSRVEAKRFVQKVYTPEAETAEKSNRTTSFRETGSFSCRHICLGRQLLPQINICCRKVMQNKSLAS